MIFQDPALSPLWEKIQTRQRLSFDEGLTLFRSADLTGLGHMAHHVRTRRHGKRTLFVVNRQINPTNICVLSCAFCDFAAREHSPRAYVLSAEEIRSRLSSDLNEVHVVGGLYHRWNFEDYLEVIRVIRATCPSVPIKAYTAVEVDFFARKSGLNYEAVLQRLKDAGLDCLPGGGAEVFSERVRKKLFPFKIGWSAWSAVHRMAHRLNIPSNATLLYGHIETLEERVDHLLKIRSLQDETQGFFSFIPLAFQPGQRRVADRGPTVVDDLKTIAVSRLLLDNIDHIKSYWVTVGEATCAMALHFGADDVDGTVQEERIMHAAGADTPERMTRDRLKALIRQAGFEPVERDGLYRPISHTPENALC